MLLGPIVALAMPVTVTEQSAPYELVPVESTPGVQSSFVGELTGSPIMYELIADEPFTFTAAVRQLSNKEQQPFSLIVIRQNDRGGGVQEVARMNVDPGEWTRARDGQVGLSFATSPAVSEPVEAGIYRVEVSTPENDGKYQLLLGDLEADLGYMEELRAARTTQAFFGYGFIMMLGSRLVYIPLLLGIVLFGMYRVWHRAPVRPTSPTVTSHSDHGTA